MSLWTIENMMITVHCRVVAGAVRISNCTLASNCKVWKHMKKRPLTCFLTVTCISTTNVKKIFLPVCIFMCCIIILLCRYILCYQHCLFCCVLWFYLLWQFLSFLMIIIFQYICANCNTNWRSVFMIGQPASPSVHTWSHCQTTDVPNMHSFVIWSGVDPVFKYLCW